MNFTYLIIDLGTFLIPLIFSFHPKLNFYKTWYAFFPAVIISGIIFIAWDIYFTLIGIWGFNPKYLVDLEVFNLPVEEILFFFCIPYACVFTYYCLDIFLGKVMSSKIETGISFFLILSLVILGIYFYDKSYTTSTFLSLAILLAISKWIFKINWLGKFYLIYAILLIPFFIVNGLLTGTGLVDPVVWYNGNEFMGYRLGTIPLEDIFYGMELILLNLLIYKYILSQRKIFS